jgi:hypothetical protein
MVGASAGVIAILVAGALYMPQLPVKLWGIIEIKYWMLAAGLVLLDILSLTGSNAGGHIAHLGGAVVAYFFIQSMRKGNEWNVYLFQVIDHIRSMIYSSRKKKTKRGFSFGDRSYIKYQDVKKKKQSPNGQPTPEESVLMDEILDKIKDHGYDSLTKDEKAFLFKISKD